MKHIKFLAIAFVSILALASCNTDQEGPIYTPQAENVSFALAKQSYTTEDATYEVPVRFVRSDAKNESTIHYTMESNHAENFTDPNNGELTFKAGEGAVTVVFKLDNMVKGINYQATLKLNDEDAAKVDTITNNAISSTSISVMCDYEWVDAGTAVFTDNLFGGGTATVKVKHAITNDFNLYKLVTPYTAAYGPADEDGIGEADIKFYLNDDNSAKGLEAGMSDWIPETGYTTYYNPDHASLGKYSYFENEGDTFYAGFLVLQDGSPVTGGSFQFTWKKWPGNK